MHDALCCYSWEAVASDCDEWLQCWLRQWATFMCKIFVYLKTEFVVMSSVFEVVSHYDGLCWSRCFTLCYRFMLCKQRPVNSSFSLLMKNPTQTGRNLRKLWYICLILFYCLFRTSSSDTDCISTFSLGLFAPTLRRFCRLRSTIC